MNFVHDYTKSMMMKLFLAAPNASGGTTVYCNFVKALEIIKDTDKLTLGIPKIIYLVGWQYMGHDDKYPAFFEVNKELKTKNDNTSLNSLIELMTEAKKYNTIVSLHINFADAYEDSPIFGEYVKNSAIIRTKNGKLAKIEKYNGKPCYKISYKEEWISGLFAKRIDKLFNMLPIEEQGTIHIDNFQCYVNHHPYVSIEEMMGYRDKMINYLAKRGVDITSEFTYREGRLTNLLYGRIVRDVISTYYPIRPLGKIAASWWTDKMKPTEYFDYYPHTYGGGLPKNKRMKQLFYGNIHGEDIWKNNAKWHDGFLEQFATINVPFFYLNKLKRRQLVSSKGRYSVLYEDDVIAFDNGDITRNGSYTKKGGECFLPFGEEQNTYLAYSISGKLNVWQVGNYKQAVIQTITASGLTSRRQQEITDGQLRLQLAKGEGALVLLTSPKK